MKIVLSGDLAARLRDDAERVLEDTDVTPEFVLLGNDGRFDADPAGCDVVLFSLSASPSKFGLTSSKGRSSCKKGFSDVEKKALTALTSGVTVRKLVSREYLTALVFLAKSK